MRQFEAHVFPNIIFILCVHIPVYLNPDAALLVVAEHIHYPDTHMCRVFYMVFAYKLLYIFFSVL